MSRGGLRVISAGAGSGKTWKVCEEIAARVTSGLDPSKVLATTFTRKAAAELKGRIQARILEEKSLPAEKRFELAERLELALIGTVHSVGHRLISRYALPMGLSPRLDVLEEDGTDRHLNRILSTFDPDSWKEISDIGIRLSMNNLHDQALSLLAAKRTNAISAEDFTEQIRSGVEDQCRLIAPDKKRIREIAPGDLCAEAKHALESISRLDDETKVTRGAVTTLRRLSSGGDRIIWRDFLTAARISAGKRSGANECLDDLRALGERVRYAAGLHGDIRGFSDLLARKTLELEQLYSRYKRERGLLDFTDLEVHMLELLQTEELADSLRSDIRFVVVDEFQDTNPIQLAIFIRLRELAEESVWVGDAKQAIYGFRGTDSKLMNEAWKRVPVKARDNLPNNYRSKAGLVEAANSLFSPVFGKGTRLEPVREKGDVAVERWILETKNNADDAAALAQGIAALHSEGIEFREIAILTRTNSGVERIASALNVMGIPVMIGQPGLFDNRECALVLSALRIIADRRDSLAAATLLHILDDPCKETPSWLEERLEALNMESAENGGKTFPWSGHPILEALARIDQRAMEPDSVVAAAIDELGVGEMLSGWGDAAQRAKNLDSLIDLASGYKEKARQEGTAATLTGLITCLEEAWGEGTDEQAPISGADAVTVLTYHKAKGLEWPVVVLTELDFQRPPSLWIPRLSGGNAAGGRPLDGRVLRWWVWPFGFNYGKPTRGSDLEKDALESPEGIDARRADEEEALRLLYVGFTRGRDKVVLTHRPGKHAWLDMLPDVNDLFDPDLGEDEHILEGCASTFLIRSLSAESDESLSIAPPKKQKWLKQKRARRSAGIDRYHSPSLAEEVDSAVRAKVETLPGAHPVFEPVPADQADRLGNAVHAYLGALPSLADLDREVVLSVAERCLKSYSMQTILSSEALVDTGMRLERWIADHYPGTVWLTEVPVRGKRNGGGLWTGFADLVLIKKDGTAVIIDHKTSIIPKEEWSDRSMAWTGQMLAYKESLESAGMVVSDVWIHLPLSGGMVGLGV